MVIRYVGLWSAEHGLTARLCRPDTADLGTRQPVWPVRPRQERQIGVPVIEMAAGDTGVGSIPETVSDVPDSMPAHQIGLCAQNKNGLPPG